MSTGDNIMENVRQTNFGQSIPKITIFNAIYIQKRHAVEANCMS